MSEEIKGAFHESLTRNNKQIKGARATAIFEDTELIYKRKIEDTTLDIRKLERNRESMLDLSPTNSTSLTPAKDFDAQNFVESDVKLSLDIRNLKIKLAILNARYDYLFGESNNKDAGSDKIDKEATNG